MRWRSAAACCWPSSAPSARRDPRGKQALLTFVLVGGGPTGVELAGTLAEIARQTLRDEFKSIDTAHARIVLVEAGSTILSSFREDLRAAARRSLQKLGVDVREGTRVTAIDAHGADVEGRTARSASRRAPSSGPRASPRRRSARTLGAPVDRAGRVIVEADLSIPGHPEVFVVGDAAAFLHQGGTALPGVVQPALQGATHAARTISAAAARRASPPFVYRDLGNMAIVGRASAIADLGWMRLTGFLGWLSWLFLHIVMLIGFRNRIIVLIEWALAYLTFQRGARLITGRDDP